MPMIMKKLRSPLENKFSIAKIAMSAILGFCLLILLAMIQKDWGRAVTLSCIAYTAAVSFFFLAQLFGFVLSQTEYSESVEYPKFEMLAKEENEWRR